jgi:SRSO17 transposase
MFDALDIGASGLLAQRARMDTIAGNVANINTTRNARGELELAYYLCCAPAGTTDEDLIRVAGSRWAVEECFQTAKTETGLDQYQVRRYDAWYRHVTLAMLAHAYLSVTAATAPKALAAASSRSRSARSAVSWHT